jgi:hypothetical protein
MDFTETESEVVNWFKLFQDKMANFINKAICLLNKIRKFLH